MTLSVIKVKFFLLTKGQIGLELAMFHCLFSMSGKKKTETKTKNQTEQDKTISKKKRRSDAKLYQKVIFHFNFLISCHSRIKFESQGSKNVVETIN